MNYNYDNQYQHNDRQLSDWYDPYFTNQNFQHHLHPSSIQQQPFSSFPQKSPGEVSRSVERPVNPDFSDTDEYRAGQAFSFSGFRGRGAFQNRLNLAGVVNSSSKVFVSIAELGIFGGVTKPFQGDANMSIWNVVPHDDGIVIVRGNIDWGSDLNSRLSVIVF
jgi:hypothetical protein